MNIEQQIQQINVEDIIPNRFQPRLEFEDTALDELSLSIKEHGIIQPLVLRRIQDKYEIIAGERRYKASKRAGLEVVPAIIANLDDNESAEVAIIENTHRRNLSCIEEAKSYKKLLDRKYITQEQLAKRLGTSQSNIANKLRLLQLDELVQKALINEQITERHARSLLRLTDKRKQVELVDKIINEKLTVRNLDDEVDKILNSYSKKNESILSSIDIDTEHEINNSITINEDTRPTYNNLFDLPNIGDKDKKSVLFNNLENESVNMNPSGLSFNPFYTPDLIGNFNDEESDNGVEFLSLESNEINESKNNVEKKVVINNQEDVINEIKKIIKQAKYNDIGIELEEFSFDNLNQMIIRISK